MTTTNTRYFAAGVLFALLLLYLHFAQNKPTTDDRYIRYVPRKRPA